MNGTDVEQERRGRCAQCGQPHAADARFCSACGALLASEPEREARKTVTAVFADLIGSTPLQERIDAESAHHVMDRFYHAMRDVLEAHDGRVAKFIGDAVVAIFGVPAVREDDALRAVQAAGAMRDALAVLNDELERDWGVRIGMRMGVNTGEVVISPEGLAVGDAMNTAARLEQAAGDGEILIGESTYRHVRHAVQCQPVDALTLKGKREPVTAFLLVHAPARGGQQRARIEAPLVGRDPELARLVDVFDDAVRERTCRLVTVIGSPGLGKTRLAEELTTALADSATVVQGRCEPTGEGITFLPVAEVLRGAAGIGEADEADIVRSKLAALLPGDPDAELLVERAGGVLGIAKPATAEETFWSVRRLLGGLARERPLVVVLDDVHWGQPTFLDLVEHLVEWARGAPILILALARPELRDMRPSLTGPDGLAADVVELVPLTDEHCRDLVSELLDRADVPEALARRVLQTTGGNPLFLGETLRMFVDDGVLKREGDGWVATMDADAVEVPPTITALLAARIERLGPDERSVVERAAVIGKQFYRGAVADLAPVSVAAGIDAHLHALHRKEVVEPDGTTWIDEPVFRFHHVLIRDAAYRTLLKDARAELHERFADWLTDKAGELVGEHEEVIAFHLEQAYEYRRELGPLDDRGRALGQRAVALLHATGRRALEREDLPAATNLLGRATGVLDDESPGAADVLIDLLEALLSAGQTDDVAAVVDRLRPLAGNGERPQAWATIAMAQLAQLTGATGLQDSLGEVASAGEALAVAGDDAGLAKAHHVRAQALGLLGQVAEVEAALDQALAAARRGGDTRRATAVLSGAPRAALWGPSPVMRSSGRCLDVVRILRMAQGNRHVEAIALRCQAVLEAMRGRDDAARQILDRCRMTLEELGLRLELLETEHYAGIVELVAGDHAAAEAHLRTAHDGFAQRGLDVGAAATAALLARALIEQGRDEEAFELTRFSEERGRENLKTTIAWCGVRARVLAGRGEHTEAEALAGRAVALADGTDALVDHGDARLDLARVLRAAEQEERALGEARRAAELYEAKGHEAGATRAAAFAHEERHAEEAAVGADVLPKGLPGGRHRRLLDDGGAAINERDEDVLRASVTDDVVVLDRRPASPRGDTHDAEGFVRSLRGFWDASDDVRSAYSVLVEAGELGLGYQVYTGHSHDGGGAFMLPMLLVWRAAGTRFDHYEIFVPEDERKALAALIDLHPYADERVAWSSVLNAMAAFNERDLDALGIPFAEAYVDLPEGRMSVEIVATAGADAVMSRLWIDAEPPVEELGQVVSLRDGVVTRVELFGAGEADHMRERFAELCAGDAGTKLLDQHGRAAAGSAEESENAIEQHYLRLCEAFNARDWAALGDLFSEEWVLIDRRPVTGWVTVRGRADEVQLFRDFLLMSDDVTGHSEFVDGDDEVAVMRWINRGQAIEADGGGPFEVAVTMVYVLRDGLGVYAELFPPEADLASLCARAQHLRPLARRLPGIGLPDQPLPVEHWLLRFMTVFDRAGETGQWDDVRELLAPEFVTIDNRRVRTFAEEPAGGREAFIDRSVSLVASTHDLHRLYELLAASPTLMAVNVAAVGRMADGDGPFEMSFSVVGEWRDGVLERAEFYDPEDELVVLERFAELEAGVQANLGSGAVGDVLTRISEAVNARDWAALDAQLWPDFALIDRRPATGWVTLRGLAEVRAMFQSFVAAAPDLVTSFEVLEGDDEVAIVHWTWRGHASQADGGGPFEDGFLMVYVARDGLGLRNESFSVDADLDELRAHAETLRSLARRRPGIGLPDEPLPVERLTGAFWGGVDEAGRTGEWVPFRALLAPEFDCVDHRTIPTMDTSDPETYIAHEVSLAAAVQDIRRRYEIIAAGAICCTGVGQGEGSLLDAGGRFELAVGFLLVFRDGLAVRLEFFEPEDEAGVLARFAELEAGASATQRSGAVCDLLTRASQSVNARDWPVVEAATAEDFVHRNRKPATGWTPMRGPAEFVAMFQSFVAASPDLETSCENVEGDDEVAIVRWRWWGHMTEADGGGPYEDGETCIVVVAGGRFVRSEAYTEDTTLAVLRARAEQLRPLASRRPGSGLPDEPLPAERLIAALARAQGVADPTGNWDAVRAILAPEFHSVDHRAVPTLNAGDAEQYIAIEASLAASARDMRLRLECIAAGPACCAAFCWQQGSLNDGDGEYEIAVGLVLEVHNGLAVRIEFFEPDDEAGMLARFAELDASGEPCAVETVIRRVCDAANARDWATLEARFDDEFVFVDRRTIRIWEDVHGPAGMSAVFRSFRTILPNVVNGFDGVEGDDEVGVVRHWWRGHAPDEDGGGPAEDAAGIVWVVRDRRSLYGEVFEPDTDPAFLRARAEELRPLARRRPGADLPAAPLPAERWILRFMTEIDRAGQAGRWDDFRELMAPEFVTIDRRSVPTLGEVVADGREAFIDREVSLVASAHDVRRPYELLAATPTLTAISFTVVGHMADGGGAFELAAGGLVQWHDGRTTSVEFFDADDEAGMLARFAELEAERPAGAVERALAGVRDAVIARDWAALAERFAEDIVQVDRRPASGWTDLRGREALVEHFRTFPEVIPDLGNDFVVVEGDDQVALADWRWFGHAEAESGGGPLEDSAMVVYVARDEMLVYVEVYPFDADRAPLLARAEELRPLAHRRPGLDLPDEPLPSETLFLTWARTIDRAGDTGDWEPLRRLLAPDVVAVDHRRPSPWGRVEGIDAYVETEMSLAAVGRDVRRRAYEVLAADADRLAGIGTMSGRLVEGDGPFELQLGVVFEWRDGLIARIELFEPTDEAAILARFASPVEAALEDPGPPRSLGTVAPLLPRIYEVFHAHDWAALAAAYAEDFVQVDSRPASGWEELRGPAAMVAHFESFLRVSPDVTATVEVVEADDEVAFGRWDWWGHATAADGGGRYEDGITVVYAARDGQLVRVETHAADADVEFLRARAEAMRPLARRRPGTGLPDEPLPVELLVVAFGQALDEAGRTGRWEEFREVLAPGFHTVDHRTLSTMNQPDTEAYIAAEASLADGARGDLRRPYECLAAGAAYCAVSCVAEGTLIEGGGPFEFPVGVVFEFRDGLAVRFELFEPDDEAGMLARFAELEGETPSSAAGSAGRVLERWIDRINARDLEGLRDCMTEDYAMVDHRPASPMGDLDREGHLERIRSMFEVSADARAVIHRHIAEIDGVWLGDIGWTGHYEQGGGAFAIPVRTVFAMRGERLSGLDAFAIDDEATALRAMMRQVATGAEDPADGPATALVLRLAEALADRDWDAVEGCFAADLELVDHRRVATLGVDEPGGEGFVARVRALVDVAADAQPVVEPLAELDGAMMMTVGWSGHMDNGGGPFVLRWRGVVQVRAGLAVRYELFDEDDETGMLGAVARLRECVGPATRVVHKITAAVTRRDWEGALAGFAPEFESIDRRRLAMLGSITGGELFMERVKSLTELAADAVLTYEPLDDRDAVTAGIVQWAGHYDEGGGAFALRYLAAIEVRDGVFVHYELFDEDDEAGMRARVDELVDGAPAPQRSGAMFGVITRVSEFVNARDWPALASALADDYVLIDRRPATGWVPLRGLAECIAMFQSFVMAAPDLETSFEILEGDEEVVIFHWTWRGHATEADGGGPFEDDCLMVLVLRDGLGRRHELFAQDVGLDVLRTRAEELRPLARRRPGSGLPDEPLPAERLTVAFVRALDEAGRTGRWEDFRELLTPGFHTADHRTLPTMNMPDIETYLAAEASLADGARGDLRRPYECFAAGAACCAISAAIEGSLSDGGGPFLTPFGVVLEFRDGLAVHFEMFEPDDEAGMLARLAELEAEAGSDAALDVLAGIRDAANARDWDALGARYAVDFLLIDRRPAAWSEIRGRQAMVELFESFTTLSLDVQAWFEPLASDDEVAVVRWGWGGHYPAADGGGAYEDALSIIFIVRDGAVVYTEHHPDEAHTDPAPLRARAEELRPLARRRPGGELPDEPLPTERWTLRFFDAADEGSRSGRWDRFRELLAPEAAVVDHRLVGPWGEMTGRESIIASEASLGASTRDLSRTYRLLAADPALTAAVVTASGRLAYGDGPFDLTVGVLIRWRDGIAVRGEFFDADDEAGMLARFADLQADAGSDPMLDFLTGARDASNARDSDALGSWFAEDLLLVDQRLMAWAEHRGRQATVELFQGFWALSSDLQVWFERLEGDDEVALVRWGWFGHAADDDGGGAFDDALTDIFVLRDGVAVYVEMHPDAAHTELAPLRARAEELRPLARRRPGADLPDESLPTEHWTLQIADELDRAGRTGHWDALRKLLAPEFVQVDHRLVPTLDNAIEDGPDGFIARQASLAGSGLDLARSYELIAAGARLAAVILVVGGRLADGGGPFELSMGTVIEWRDGMALRVELFDPEDETTMLARFAELESGSRSSGTEEVLAGVRDTYNAHDWEGLGACFADDFLMVDRRLASWSEIRGRDAIVEHFQSFPMLIPDGQASFDRPDFDDDEVAIVRWWWRGHADDALGGGPLEDVVMMLLVMRDGVGRYVEVYPPDTDPEHLRPRAEELRPLAIRRPGIDLPDEPLPSERWLHDFLVAWNATGSTGRWDAFAELLAADISVADHRVLPTLVDGPGEGGEEFLAREVSFLASSLSVERSGELLAASATLTAVVGAARGRMKDGGGPYELHVGILLQWHDRLCVRLEFFEPEDEDVLLARFHELEAGGRRNAVVEVLGRVRDAFNARDWGSLEACYDDQFVLVNHRPASGWDNVHGPVAMIEMFRTFHALLPDIQCSFDPIEGDDEVATYLWSWRGHATAADGGGPMEDGFAAVSVVRGGRSLRAEGYSDDTDVELLRRRAEELRPLVRRRPGTDLPDEPLPAEGWFLRLGAELDRAGRTGQWETVRGLLAPDFRTTDRRGVSTLGALRGRDEYLETEIAFAASSNDLSRPYELVAASGTLTAASVVVKGRMLDGGGPFQLAVGVLVQWRDGIAVRIEFFEADDEEAMLARFAELDAAGPRHAVAGVLGRVRDTFDARDWAALEACFDDEYVFVNHRPAAGWDDLQGPRAMGEMFRTFHALIPDMQSSFELLEGDDEVGINLWSWRGHATAADGGGAMEDGFAVVHVVRGGRFLRSEAYPDDTDIELLRRPAEQLRPLARRRPSAGLPDEPLPAERWTMRYFVELDEASRTGRWETFRELLAPDFAGVDHRLASMNEINDREEYIAFESILATSSQDLRRSYELFAASETATAMIVTGQGTMTDGGGAFELHLGILLVWRDGVAVRIEGFDGEDEKALVARFDELTFRSNGERT